MINLDELTIFNDVRERLTQITPEHIASAERKLMTLPVDGASVIGIIENQATRALHALKMLLDGEAALQKALAQSAIDETIEKDHNEKAALSDMISDVVKELFWCQAKIDLGFYEFEDIGIRAGWRLVRQPKHDHMRSLGAILRL